MNMIPTMSEADLQRLAQILQERGEGLAAINSGEAQLLKAFGGSGEALPGTSGMGPGGGPIRSYDNGNGNGNGDNGGGGYDESKDSDRLGGDTHDTPPSDGKSEIERHHEEYLKSLEKQGSGNNNNYVPPPPPKYYDTLGNEYSTPEARDAANAEIKVEQDTLAGSFTNLMTDSNFEVMKAKGELPTFKYLSEDDVFVS